MNTRSLRNIAVKIMLLAGIFLFNGICAFASDAVILGINVKQNISGEYSVIMKVDKPIKVSKYANGTDNLTIMVNSALPSDSLEIVYDNASDLENVIVRKKNDNNTVILLQGNNAANSLIYTKDLTTGNLKLIDNNNFINNMIFITDKKYTAISLLAIFLFFALNLLLRPKNKRYQHLNNNISNVKKTNLKADTLRNKNLIQHSYIPSINYHSSNVFGAVNHNMSTPKEFVINRYNEETEKIRKAG